MLDDTEVFRRLATPGEQDDEDWRETIYEKVLADGVLVGEHHWSSDNPGAGAGATFIREYRGLFFVESDSSDGVYETFDEAADDCMLFEKSETTVQILVDPRFRTTSE
jgi:hypothetical protein